MAARALLALLLVLSACSAVSRHDAVPTALQEEARVLEMPANIRYRVGTSHGDAALAQEFVQSWKRERDYLASRGLRGSLRPTTFLALSGGGDDGAFGAGLLSGWTAAGNRPEFKLVTGISTGALI